jgi:transcription antitermination factor NusG
VCDLGRWYALSTKSNHERAARAALCAHGFDTFLPSLQVRSQWSDRVRMIDRPLFPGYLFARAVCPAPFLDCAGVTGILPSALAPLAVPDLEIEAVRRMISSPFAVAVEYVTGDKVTIRSGPLAGVSGVVLRRGGRARLVVAVEILRRAVAVEIDAEALGKSE